MHERNLARGQRLAHGVGAGCRCSAEKLVGCSVRQAFALGGCQVEYSCKGDDPRIRLTRREHREVASG